MLSLIMPVDCGSAVSIRIRPLRRLDDVDGDAVGADIVDVADQLKRLERRGPFFSVTSRQGNP